MQRHLRAVLALHGLGWLIVDRVVDRHVAAEAEIFWHLHPAWRAAVREHDALYLVTRPGGGSRWPPPPGTSPCAQDRTCRPVLAGIRADRTVMHARSAMTASGAVRSGHIHSREWRRH